MDVSWTKTHEEQLLSTGLRDGDSDSDRTAALSGHNSRQGFLMRFLPSTKHRGRSNSESKTQKCEGCQKANIDPKGKTTYTVEAEKVGNIHTDIEQIIKWFPDLVGIQSTQWEILMDDEGDYTSLPAPGSYTASGYIFLNQEIAEKYLEEYEREAAEPEVNFHYVSSNLLNNKNWMFSRQFDKDFRPLKFIGKLWFNGEAILFTGGR